MVVIHFKKMIDKRNLLFLIGSIIATIFVLNLYSRLLQGPLQPTWVAFAVIFVSSVIGIFFSGWIVGLRRWDMHRIEFYLTIIFMLLIMVALNKYYPQLLYGANAFIEPARETLVDISRGVFAK